MPRAWVQHARAWLVRVRDCREGHTAQKVDAHTGLVTQRPIRFEWKT